MFFDVKTLLKGLYISLFRRRFSVRRWFWTLLFVGIFLSLFFFNLPGRLLDHLFFWRYRRQTIDEPIFIIANPRSGTTFLHRLMALDSERFQYIKLYQALLPSITHQKVLHGIAWVDTKVGRPLHRLVQWSERKLFGGWDSVHQLGFERAEEDEAFMFFTLLTPGLWLLFPWVDQLSPAIGHGDLLSPRRRRKFMSYYRSVMQRHLWQYGPDQTMLSKNTLLSGRFESLLETFPDARVVYLLRHPYEAVPSFISMWHGFSQLHSRDIAKVSPETRALGRVAMFYYRYTHEQRSRFAPDRFTTLRYEDLVADPRGAVQQVYEHFGIEMTEAFTEQLNAATEQSRQYKSRHHYSLEEFGLTREQVQQELGDILDHYGFER